MPRHISLILLGALCPLVHTQERLESPTPAAPSDVEFSTNATATRWIVHFKKRSFDLSSFRNAIRERRSASEVATIVEGLEVAMSEDQAPFVRACEQLGGRVTHQWWLINAACVELDAEGLEELRRWGNVALIERDRLHRGAIRVATNANNHAADAVQAAGYSGAGVAVAILDTGQDVVSGATGRPHRTYFVDGDPNNVTGGGIRGTRLLFNRQVGSMGAEDPTGHGTAVTAVAAGAPWGTLESDAGHASEAGIASYALSDDAMGRTNSTTLISAWQQVAADRVAYSIVSANHSYTGYADPLLSTNRAMDSVALNADVLCTLAAGNGGASPNAAQISPGAVNGIAVGAVTANTHVRWPYSTLGPLPGDPLRTFPDLVACGDQIVTARTDIETQNATFSGTSLAAPHVAGAAATLRARFPNLTALETRAILYASAADITAQNLGENRNRVGLGFLRTDRAHDLVSTGSYGEATVSLSQPEHSFVLPAIAGQTFSIAIAWNRQDVMSTDWSNLDLLVLGPNGSTLVAAEWPRNVYELIRFRSPLTGNLTVRIAGRTIEGGSQEFAYAITDSPGAGFPASIAAFGAGCDGTGGPICPSINPNGRALQGFSNAFEYAIPFTATAPLDLTGIEVRTRSNTGVPVTITLSIYDEDAGEPALLPRQSTTVQVGVTGDFYTGVFTPAVSLPAGRFWVGVDNRGLDILDPQLRVGTFVACSQRGTQSSWQHSPNVTRPAVRALCGPNRPQPPRHTFRGRPILASTLHLELSHAATSSPVVLIVGLSNASWFGLTLPFDLGVYGAPGCTLAVGLDIPIALVTSHEGTASLPALIPNDSSLIALPLFTQFAVVDPGANALGLVSSNGLAMRLGDV